MAILGCDGIFNVLPKWIEKEINTHQNKRTIVLISLKNDWLIFNSEWRNFNSKLDKLSLPQITHKY